MSRWRDQLRRTCNGSFTGSLRFPPNHRTIKATGPTSVAVSVAPARRVPRNFATGASTAADSGHTPMKSKLGRPRRAGADLPLQYAVVRQCLFPKNFPKIENRPEM